MLAANLSCSLPLAPCLWCTDCVLHDPGGRLAVHFSCAKWMWSGLARCSGQLCLKSVVESFGQSFSQEHCYGEGLREVPILLLLAEVAENVALMLTISMPSFCPPFSSSSGFGTHALSLLL